MAPKAPSRSHQLRKSSKEKEEEEEEREKSPPLEVDVEENESESEKEEEEEESEDESDQKQTKTPNPQSKSGKPKDNGWIESDTDSDSESDASPSDYKLQPINKPSTTTIPSKRRRTATTTAPSRSSPRSIKKPKNQTELKEKKSIPPSFAIPRVWSNADEITVLKGMYDFKNLEGIDPVSDLGAFYDWIKGKLQANYSKEQLRNKIRSMRRRFDNAIKKCVDDSDPVFSKPHEVLAFEHSKKVWGDSVEKIKNAPKNGVKETNAKKETLVKMVDEKEKGEKEGDFLSKYPFLKASFDDTARNYPSLVLGMKFVKDNMSLIGCEKAKELDEKWKQLLVEETEFNYKKAAFVRVQVKKLLG